MFYLVKTPGILKKLYPGCTWNLSREEKTIYLTFDDGPHETATPFVLDTLARFKAKATFFCIGKNVTAHPEIYKRILTEGHSVGNHTHNHLNGAKSINEEYIADIKQAKKYIDSKLFRPPYGRITRFQIEVLKKAFTIIMWDVLSADFDTTKTPEKCAENVIKNAREGSIVVFHDSQKAFNRLEHALPASLEYFTTKGYSFKSIQM